MKLGFAFALCLLLTDVTVAQAQLVASVLPSSRTVQVGATATAFASVINTGSSTATGCSIAAPSTLTSAGVSFLYQTTNPATNALTGTPNTPVNIPAGGLQTFLIALTPSAPVPATDVALIFGCTTTSPATTIIGVNTLQFLASADPVPDIVALAATVSGNGIVTAAPNGAFAVATVNVGADGLIVASANTGSASLPLTITLCQTNASGNCVATAAPSQLVSMPPNSTSSFAIFVTATGGVPFSPGTNRIFVRFRDFLGGIGVGATSVAVRNP